MDASAAPESDLDQEPRAPRPRLSQITSRILAVNVVALAILFGGLLYLDQYRRSLISADLESLKSQAELFAAALGEGATSRDPSAEEGLIDGVAQQMVRRLVETAKIRVRVFGDDGALIADSFLLMGPGGAVQVDNLPPPRAQSGIMRQILRLYDWSVDRFTESGNLSRYEERAVQTAADYPEVMRALAGDVSARIRLASQGGLMLSAAAPIQRYKQVLGGLLVTKGSAGIDAEVFEVRLDIFKVFLVALGATVLLSLYLAETIARPLLKLARAAERVRGDRQHIHKIPDFSNRRDEIGQLAGALQATTEALWSRIDAIERFAADVAHEIKNPLTSLRSAVETAARVNDPARREKLMAIILEDVRRLDRLITDISNASRLDAQLSREEFSPVNVGRMLDMLAETTETAAAERGVRFVLRLDDEQRLVVPGLEGRLVQVFSNLIANALSFSPPGSVITLGARRDGKAVVVEVLDQGPGIPAGEEEIIFRRFYSARPQGEKFGTHSGLGLSISKQIVDAHGGRIVAENRVEGQSVKGARFVVSLPIG